MTNPADDVLARVHREEHSRLLASLVRRFGDLDLAEDAAQEAMEAAMVAWPAEGVPRQPLAWLITTSRRKALDRVRRDATLARRIAQLHLETEHTTRAAEDDALVGDDFPDERLAMLMGCCHPAIAPADRIALMLRFVGGLTTAEVAQALLLPVTTLQARITRAKKRITANRIPLVVPDDMVELERRLPLVLTAISLVFTEGYDATAGEHHMRTELTTEAIRLARITHTLLPDHAEPAGLLALLLLTDARTPARADCEGVPVPLADQDRTSWRGDLITEGTVLAEKAASMPGADRFTIQAAIAAVHAEARRFEDTDWDQIVALYDLLLARRDDPVVRMNRAIAVAQPDEPEVGLRLLRALADEPELGRHHPYHVAVALLLEETGDPEGATHSWQRALDLVDNRTQRRFIERRFEA